MKLHEFVFYLVGVVTVAFFAGYGFGTILYIMAN